MNILPRKNFCFMSKSWSVKLNSKPVTDYKITNQQIWDGGMLGFRMR